jgi:hypothetical protein
MIGPTNRRRLVRRQNKGDTMLPACTADDPRSHDGRENHGQASPSPLHAMVHNQQEPLPNSAANIIG